MCRINCSGGCPECTPEEHSEEAVKLWEIEGLIEQHSLFPYPWNELVERIKDKLNE